MSLAECFRTLGLTQGASWEEVRQAYLDLVRVWHPDRFQSDPHLSQVAEQKLKKINEAYFALKRSKGVFQSRPNAAPHAAPEGEAPASPVDARPVHTSPLVRRWLPNRLLYAAAVGVVCLTPAYLGMVVLGRLTSLFQNAVPDIDLIHARLLRPAVLTPSRVLSPLLDRSIASETLTAWARGEVVDLWRPLPKSGERPPARVVDLSERKAGPQDGGVTPAETRRAHRVGPGALAMPVNGSEMLWARQSPGTGELWISNETELDALATLVQSRRTSPLRAIYIQARSKACLRQIAAGLYDVAVQLGTDWDPKTLRFRTGRYSPGRSGPFDFYEVTTAAGNSGCRYDIVLKPRS